MGCRCWLSARLCTYDDETCSGKNQTGNESHKLLIPTVVTFLEGIQICILIIKKETEEVLFTNIKKKKYYTTPKVQQEAFV